MPALSSLTREVTLGQHQLALAVVLSSISSRLPLLRDLHLTCADSWEEGAQRVWEQLGSVTQVTRLEVTFDTDRGCDVNMSTAHGCMLAHLAPLRNLTGLQQLCIDSCICQQPGAGQGEQGDSFQFLEALTALTHLNISVPSTQGFPSISSCTALQVLRLLPARRGTGGCHLTAADWEAVGQLARLTALQLSRRHQTPVLPKQQNMLL